MGTSAPAPQRPAVTYTGMGTVDPDPHGSLRGYPPALSRRICLDIDRDIIDFSRNFLKNPYGRHVNKNGGQHGNQVAKFDYQMVANLILPLSFH
ncbi:hypothetical protein TNCV_4713831 [Trichonephila clavipes]|nr:hypothetical protein TNCV_4713831 [Trichonephila clavipes]